MSIEQRNRIEALERRLALIEATVNLLCVKTDTRRLFLEGESQEQKRTLTLPEKRKSA